MSELSFIIHKMWEWIIPRILKILTMEKDQGEK